VALFLSSPPLRAAALVEQGRDGKAVLNDLTEKAPYKFGPTWPIRLSGTVYCH